MKSVTFLRHCRLNDPYADYDKMSWDELRNLSTDRIDPNIHPDSPQAISEKFTRKYLQEFDMILCSPSKRAQRTAEWIQRLSGKDLKIEESKTLREISFDPALLTTKEKFLQDGLPEIRATLFRGMIQKEPGVEALDDILIRVDTLTELLEQAEHKNILCITHSFYMRVLRLYLPKSFMHCQDITIYNLMDTPDYDYLEGFTRHLREASKVSTPVEI
jgi:broad specificity phosphatase PhoE